MKEIILIIIFILLVINIKETFDNKVYYNNFRYYELSPLNDNFTGEKIELSREKSIKLYNYLLNFNFNSPINSVDKDETLFIYLQKFDNNIEKINLILRSLNLFLNKKYSNNFNISKENKVLDYVKKINNFNRTKFINTVGNNSIRANNYTKSYFLIDEVFNLLTDNNIDLLELKNMSLRDCIISYLSNKGILELKTINDYNSMDIFLNGVEEYIKSHVSEIFGKSYENILNLKLIEVRNIYYSGEKNDFSFN